MNVNNHLIVHLHRGTFALSQALGLFCQNMNSDKQGVKCGIAVVL